MFGIKKLKNEVAYLKFQNGVLQGIIDAAAGRRRQAAKLGWQTRKMEAQ